MQIRVVVVVGLLLLLAVGLFLYRSNPNAGSAVKPSAPPAVTVIMTDTSLQPSEGSVAKGKVTFTVTNKGTMEHEFVVLKADLAPDALPIQSNATAVEENTDIHHIGELEDLQPGATKTLTLSLESGRYILLCNLPGHYLAGMYAGLDVR